MGDFLPVLRSRYILAHRAAVPVTERDVLPAEAPAGPNGLVATYLRNGSEPYTVIHDRRGHSATGMFRVFVGYRFVGTQASHPSADDCARMDLPNRYALPATYTALIGQPLAKSVHQELAAGAFKKGSALIRTVEGVKVKRCAGCKTDHPLSAFSQGTGPGGLHRHCREYQKLWRAERMKPIRT